MKLKKSIVFVVFFYQLIAFAQNSITLEQGAEKSFYIFAEPSSCFTCLKSVNYYYNLSQKNKDVSFILFLKGIKNNQINFFRNQYNWDFEIIADPVGAYEKFYNINFLPQFIVIDSKNNILLRGKCGGTKISDDSLLSVLNQNTSLKSNNYKNNLRHISSISLQNFDKNLVFSKKRFTIISKDLRKALIANSNFREYILLDLDKKNYRKFSLDTHKFQSLFMFKPDWAYGDSIILGVDMDFKANRLLYFLNTKDNKLNFIGNNIFINNKKYNKGLNFYFNEKLEQIIGYLLPLESSKLSFNDSLIYFIDKNGNFVRNICIIDSLFTKNKLSFSYDILTAINYEDNEYYFLINPIRKIFYVDFEGLIKKVVNIKLDSNFKFEGYLNKNFGDDNKTIDELIDLNLKTSQYSNIFFDKNYKKIYISYFKRIIPNNKQAELSLSDISLQYYLSGFDILGNRIWRDDIKFPLGEVPRFINNNILVTDEFRMGNLILHFYEIIQN